MHNYCGTDDGKIQFDLIRDRDLQASYTEDDFMNLDDNIFELDAESRELFFGTPLSVALLMQIQDAATWMTTTITLTTRPMIRCKRIPI
jgi:hypothetical protein